MMRYLENSVIRCGSRTAIVLLQLSTQTSFIEMHQAELRVHTTDTGNLEIEGWEQFDYPVAQAAERYLAHHAGVSNDARRALQRILLLAETRASAAEPATRPEEDQTVTIEATLIRLAEAQERTANALEQLCDVSTGGNLVLEQIYDALTGGPGITDQIDAMNRGTPAPESAEAPKPRRRGRPAKNADPAPEPAATTPTAEKTEPAVEQTPEPAATVEVKQEAAPEPQPETPKAESEKPEEILTAIQLRITQLVAKFPRPKVAAVLRDNAYGLNSVSEWAGSGKHKELLAAFDAFEAAEQDAAEALK